MQNMHMQGMPPHGMLPPGMMPLPGMPQMPQSSQFAPFSSSSSVPVSSSGFPSAPHQAPQHGFMSSQDGQSSHGMMPIGQRPPILPPPRNMLVSCLFGINKKNSEKLLIFYFIDKPFYWKFFTLFQNECLII